MKSLSTFIAEAITYFDKPDKKLCAEIDMVKFGKLIEKAGGNDGALVFSFRKDWDATIFKIDTKGQIFQNNEHTKPWSKTRDIFKVFNKASMRMTETKWCGMITKPEDEILNLYTPDDMKDEKATQKLCKLLDIKDVRIGTNSWLHLHNALLKVCRK